MNSFDADTTQQNQIHLTQSGKRKQAQQDRLNNTKDEVNKENASTIKSSTTNNKRVEMSKEGIALETLKLIGWAGSSAGNERRLQTCDPFPSFPPFYHLPTATKEFNLFAKEILQLPKINSIKELREFVNVNYLQKKETELNEEETKLYTQAKLLHFLCTPFFFDKAPQKNVPIETSNNSNCNLKVISYEEFEKEEKIEISKKLRPSLLLRFPPPPLPHSLSSEYGKIIGFHGSHLGNFHSIIHNGLETKHIKLDHGLFGDGIYFAKDPSIARNFIQFVDVDKQFCDIFGTRVGCMAVCEIIGHPSVKIGRSKVAEDNITKHSTSALRAMRTITIAPNMPPDYILVQNKYHAQLKYLFIFGTKRKEATRVKLLWIIIIYAIVLMLIAAVKSPYWKRLTARLK